MGKRNRPQRQIPQKYQASFRQKADAASQQKIPPIVKPPLRPKQWALLILFWSYVLIPLSWGIASTAQKALSLFK